MQVCTFSDFLETLKPWLDRDYVRKGYLKNNGVFILFFTDGGEKHYHVDDCSESRLKKVFEMMVEKGIPVEKGE